MAKSNQIDLMVTEIYSFNYRHVIFDWISEKVAYHTERCELHFCSLSIIDLMTLIEIHFGTVIAFCSVFPPLLYIVSHSSAKCLNPR